MQKKKILMVCLGNICRSPLAEALLRKKVNSEKVIVDSAGLDSYHIGEPPCKTSIDIAAKNGLDITNLRARQFTSKDFDKFDKIYIMDLLNRHLIKKMAKNKDQFKKVDLILNEVFPGEDMEVPDSFQKGDSAAKLVYDMLDKATTAIAKKSEQ
jgi:protein-tyrosine phosphatase